MKTVESLPPLPRPQKNITSEVDERDILEINNIKNEDLGEIGNEILLDIQDLQNKFEAIKPLSSEKVQIIESHLQKLEEYLDDSTKEKQFAELFEETNDLIEVFSQEKEKNKQAKIRKGIADQEKQAETERLGVEKKFSVLLSEILKNLDLLSENEAKAYHPLIKSLMDLRDRNITDAYEYAKEVRDIITETTPELEQILIQIQESLAKILNPKVKGKYAPFFLRLDKLKTQNVSKAIEYAQYILHRLNLDITSPEAQKVTKLDPRLQPKDDIANADTKIPNDFIDYIKQQANDDIDLREAA